MIYNLFLYDIKIVEFMLNIKLTVSAFLRFTGSYF